MIAVDTNVLLRYLLQDDERKAVKAKATALFNTGKKILIRDVVLAETIGTLKGKKLLKLSLPFLQNQPSYLKMTKRYGAR